MRLFLSASAASEVSASTKWPPNSVSYVSAPLRVAVTIVRPGPDSSATNGPLALVVLTKTICFARSLSSSGLNDAGGHVGADGD